MNDDAEGESSSRARDHLANERTFLAWLRTASEIMVLGLFIAKVGGASAPSVSAGALLVATGVAGLLYGTVRYRRVTDEIEENRFVTGSRGTAMAVTAAVLTAAILAALALLVAGSSSV